MSLIKKVLRWSSLPSLILFIVFFILNGFITEGFLTLSSFAGFLQSITPLIILAIGEAVVLLGGGIDISIGATLSMANVILATLSLKNFPIISILTIVILSGLVIGALNGFLISILRISPLLVTFATSYIAGGIALTILPIPGGSAPESLVDFYLSSSWSIIPNSIFFILVIYLIWLIWDLSPSGTYLYAIGNDIRKAYFSGISVVKVQFATYLFAGLAASIAAIALTGNIGAGDARVGLPMTLNAVAACVIGGISLMGGIGSISGAIFGTLFLGLVLTTVLGMGIPTYYQQFVSGLIVVLGIFVAVIIGRKRQSKSA
ncbi:ABC transporter permease [Moorella sp. Hama-1]|uniref:ABC transporter permease n=1 Tax=Moorella sp. Hama-1 TaxID=2138101 RepID=UPI000D655C54|nr:ABC transporter permease [Moorella sp. Hama-1]BCV21390.1 ABC transporter permease [Moorella sp. Hama-1]